MIFSFLPRAALTTKFVTPQLLLPSQSISGCFVWRFASGISSKLPTKRESKTVKINKDDKNLPIKVEKPRRPINTFMRFFMEFLANNTQFNRRSAMHPAGVAWKTLDAKDKQKYEKQYAIDMARHRLEMKAWQEKMITEGHLELLQKSLLTKVCADIGKPKRPPSPFLNFLNSRAQSDQPRIAIIKAAVEEWKKLPDAEKEKYNPKYAAQIQAYADEMRSWKKKMIADGKGNVLLARKTKKRTKLHEAKKENKSKLINHDDDEGFE